MILFFITLAGACLFFYGFKTTADSWSKVDVWDYMKWYSTTYAGDARIVTVALEAAWASVTVWILLALIEFGCGLTTKNTVVKPGKK